MAVDSLGPRREPEFSDNGAPDIAVDPTAVAKYAAEFGNLIVGNTAYRTAASAWAWEGLHCYDTQAAQLYVNLSGAWTPTSKPDTSTSTAGPNVNINTRTIHKIGNLVVLNIWNALRTEGWTAGATVLTVNTASFRPTSRQALAAFNTTTAAPLAADIDTGGIVRVYGATAAHNVSISGSWVRDS